MFGWIGKKNKPQVERKDNPAARLFIMGQGMPRWSNRDYRAFAEEAYVKNAVASACISMIASAVASVELGLFRDSDSDKVKISNSHPLMKLINNPNPTAAWRDFVEGIVSFYLISGNAYIAVNDSLIAGAPKELWLLRPDRVQIIEDASGLPAGYLYRAARGEKRFDPESVLHIKSFHPTDDWYGMSPIDPAAHGVDILNSIAKWNMSLVDNAAMPTGALQSEAAITDDQYARLKEDLDNNITGTKNAGRPLILDGGLKWVQMSINPKDMDFLENYNTLARQVALVFGVPPQLLGIPGDSTYNNMAQANLDLWERRVIPILERILARLNGWLAPRFGDGLQLGFDRDSISALEPRRKEKFDRMKGVDFLTKNEKRRILGFDDLPEDYIKLEADDVAVDDLGKIMDTAPAPDKPV